MLVWIAGLPLPWTLYAMSTLRVTVETLEIRPHPNADALELAVIGGYRAVVAKGAYESGQLAVYIPEQALLPASLVTELGLEGRLAGPGKNRIKAIRLRGELSQGIVFVPLGWTQDDLASRRDLDLAPELGITKWAPEIPAHFSGIWIPAPDIVPYTEIENIKRYPGVFSPGEPVVATEKTHGTLTIFSLGLDATLEVASKSLAKAKRALHPDPANLYWRTAEAHNIEPLLEKLLGICDASRVTLFGESYGAGVQDLHYGADARRTGPGFVAFDIHVVGTDGLRRYLDAAAFAEVATEVGLTPAPVLYQGPYDYTALAEKARGPETISGTEAHIREGLVVRPLTERHSEVLGGRAIAKFISEEYLTRSGGTELE